MDAAPWHKTINVEAKRGHTRHQELCRVQEASALTALRGSLHCFAMSTLAEKGLRCLVSTATFLWLLGHGHCCDIDTTQVEAAVFPVTPSTISLVRQRCRRGPDRAWLCLGLEVLIRVGKTVEEPIAGAHSPLRAGVPTPESIPYGTIYSIHLVNWRAVTRASSSTRPSMLSARAAVASMTIRVHPPKRTAVG